jgi:hypothetical protein
MNLLVRLRRFIAQPMPALAPLAENVSPARQPGDSAGPADESCVPVEALTGAARQRHFARLGRVLQSAAGELDCRVAAAHCCAAALPDPDMEIPSIRLFRAGDSRNVMARAAHTRGLTSKRTIGRLIGMDRKRPV